MEGMTLRQMARTELYKAEAAWKDANERFKTGNRSGFVAAGLALHIARGRLAALQERRRRRR